MAYIEGRPLKDFTKSKKLHSEKQIAVTIRKIAQGLHQAHQIGVVHRDLKPANIMVDQSGEPVVMDFGLARRNDSDDVQVTQSGTILGTPAYMSPEQVEGDQAKIGPQTDIYALGVIMYELLAGRRPYEGAMMSILQQIAVNKPNAPSEYRPHLDPELEEICLKMMQGDLSTRYQSMKKVVADLQKIARTLGKKNPTTARKTPKPTSIPTAAEESSPALISIAKPSSIAEELRKKKAIHSGNKSWLSIAVGLISFTMICGVIILARIGKYDVMINLADPNIKVSVDGETLQIEDGGEIIRLSAGAHQLKLQKDGLETSVEEFTVTKDGETIVTAAIVEGKLDAFIGDARPSDRNLLSANTTKNNPQFITADNGPVELITIIQPVLDTIIGAGERIDRGELQLTRNNEANGIVRLELPMEIEGDYTLRCEYVVTGGSYETSFIIPLGPVQGELVFGSNNNNRSGFGSIEGQPPYENGTSRRHMGYETGKPYVMTIRKSLSGEIVRIIADIDGGNYKNEAFVNWTGPIEKISLRSGLGTMDKRGAALQAYRDMKIKSIVLHMHSGQARIRRREDAKKLKELPSTPIESQ